MAFDFFGRQSPNIWWPDDQARCVATEIDFAWTYVGGSTAAIEAVLADPRLEALPARATHRFTHDSDLLNAALDVEWTTTSHPSAMTGGSWSG
jgi:hypothetical protein